MTPHKWLIRIPAVFDAMEADILRELDARCLRRLGRDFLAIELPDPSRIRESAAAKCIPWNLPLQHMWPCKPLEIPGFIEKAAQALTRKFLPLHPQTLLAGALAPDAAHRKYRTLASNLRGRTLQLFPPAASAIRDVETQDSRAPTLYALVGPEGLFCGVSTPLDANGFHPGGIRFIRQNDATTISRAGAKIAGALHHLKLHQPLPEPGAHWLELGASPGGMTAELLARGYRVTAIDRAPLDPRLTRSGGPTTENPLRFILADAANHECTPGRHFDAILCDMNGDARTSMRTLCRHAAHLKPHGVVVFTLKMPDADSYPEIQSLAGQVLQTARDGGLAPIALTHLAYNRHEFTMILRPLSLRVAAICDRC